MFPEQAPPNVKNPNAKESELIIHTVEKLATAIVMKFLKIFASSFGGVSGFFGTND